MVVKDASRRRTMARKSGPSPDGLTLACGKIEARFKVMTWRDIERMKEEIAVMDMRLQVEHGVREDVLASQTSDQKASAEALRSLNMNPDFVRYNARREKAEWFPWLMAASDGSLSLDDFMESTDDEIMDCMIQVALLHPHRVIEMPYLVQYAYQKLPDAKGDGDPN